MKAFVALLTTAACLAFCAVSHAQQGRSYHAISFSGAGLVQTGTGNGVNTTGPLAMNNASLIKRVIASNSSLKASELDVVINDSTLDIFVINKLSHVVYTTVATGTNAVTTGRIETDTTKVKKLGFVKSRYNINVPVAPNVVNLGVFDVSFHNTRSTNTGAVTAITATFFGGSDGNSQVQYDLQGTIKSTSVVYAF